VRIRLRLHQHKSRYRPRYPMSMPPLTFST
jgi:hypothetical protein